MPLSGSNKHDVFFDLNLTHHVSDVTHGSDPFTRRQQFVNSAGTPCGMAYKARERSFELDRSALWKKKEDSGETNFLGDPIYVFVDPYEYYLTATASGESEEPNGDKTEYRGSRTYELNADEDSFVVASDTFESRDYDASEDTWTSWVAIGTPPDQFLSYSSQYTDSDAKTHVDNKLASATWGQWSSIFELGIFVINGDVAKSVKADIGDQVSREEAEYQFFINTPPSLYTEVEWYEAEYNNYENSTADSLKVSDGGQIIQGGIVSGRGNFQGLVGYINELDNPESLDSRVRFTATVSDLTTGEYQHYENEYLLEVDEVFELFARFRSGGEEVPLTMTPINQALSAPVIQGAVTFNAELVYVNCAAGQSVDFLKVGQGLNIRQSSMEFSSIRLCHYWKPQNMVLDVYFRVAGYESLIGWIPMTGGRLNNPVITGYRTEAEPEGFPMNMEYQEFEAAGTTTLTPTRKNYACVKAVPAGSTRVVEEFTGFPSGYDGDDPETWNACEVRTLSPTWPDSPTSNSKDTRNTAYAQVPTVRCS